jgi:hypothetical protein
MRESARYRKGGLGRGDQQGTTTAMWPNRGAGNHPTEAQKRIEPHDWQQGATNLRVIQRNKPTRS